MEPQDTGLDPTLGALLPLAGVMLGALLAGVGRYWLDKRAERAHFRAAVWMMIDDLGRMRDILADDGGARTALGTPQSATCFAT